MKRDRYGLLDTIRGIVLSSMIIYHACWNFVYIYGMNWRWYKSEGAYLWQQSICWTFIFLSGFCFLLGRRHLKNGICVFGSGLLVTLVTLVFMPQNRVVFGVLTCIGSCILLATIWERNLRKIPQKIGALVCFILFLFTKNINSGTLGFGTLKIVDVPETWFQNLGTAFLGFPPGDFYSTDYFSLFPWMFLFFTGVFVYRMAEHHCWMESNFIKKDIPFFSFLGRHSLIIYLLHQPVLYGVQEFIF